MTPAREWLPPPPPDRRALTPIGSMAFAAAVVFGALVAQPMSLLVPAGVALGAVAVRRPVLLGLAAMVAASALGARAVAGLDGPTSGSVTGEMVLVSDPVVRWGRAEAIGRIDGRLVQVRAGSPAAEVVAARLAGEHVRVSGRYAPLGRGAAALRVRHVSARLEVRTASGGSDAASPFRAANHLRRLLTDGAEPLGDDRRSLLLGLVLGDDRAQTPEMTDDFRGSGLAHLLAVSGQNVAFVLAAAAPLLRRLGLMVRVGAVVAVLAAFATVTRFEPSVLRAVVMAGLGALAAARGRPTPGVQILALAVTGLVLVDPLLVRSTGFQLSVAATAGILLLSPRLMDLLPGPAPVVLPVAVSVSAQIAVAPLIVASFGGVPVASLPANIAAAPAAAMAMMWGLPLGLVAGMVGSPLDQWIHAPTGLALSWIAGVARTAASVPLGELRWPQLAVVATAVTALLASRRLGRSRDAVVAASAVALTVAVIAPGVALRHPPAEAQPVDGVVVWRSGGATVVAIEPGTGAARTLLGLRRAGVTQVDLLVVGPGGSALDEERAARHRSRVRRVWDRGGDPPPDRTTRLGGLTVLVSSGQVCVAPVGDAPCAPTSARDHRPP